MTKKEPYNPVTNTFQQLKNILINTVDSEFYEILDDFFDEAYDLGYQEGIAEGVRVEKVKALGIDPYSDEGAALRAKMEIDDEKAASQEAKETTGATSQ